MSRAGLEAHYADHELVRHDGPGVLLRNGSGDACHERLARAAQTRAASKVRAVPAPLPKRAPASWAMVGALMLRALGLVLYLVAIRPLLRAQAALVAADNRLSGGQP